MAFHIIHKLCFLSGFYCYCFKCDCKSVVSISVFIDSLKVNLDFEFYSLWVRVGSHKLASLISKCLHGTPIAFLFRWSIGCSWWLSGYKQMTSINTYTSACSFDNWNSSTILIDLTAVFLNISPKGYTPTGESTGLLWLCLSTLLLLHT